MAVDAFEAPFRDLPHRVRAGNDGALDLALSFLRADPWCFRSGYLKARVLRAVSAVPLTEAQRGEGRDIVLRRLSRSEPGLSKATASLARSIWDGGLLTTVAAHSNRTDAARLLLGVQRRLAPDDERYAGIAAVLASC